MITRISETVIASVFCEAISCFGGDCFVAKQTLLAVTRGLWVITSLRPCTGGREFDFYETIDKIKLMDIELVLRR